LNLEKALQRKKTTKLLNYCIAQVQKMHSDNINCYTLTFSDILLWIKLPKINQLSGTFSEQKWPLKQLKNYSQTTSKKQLVEYRKKFYH